MAHRVALEGASEPRQTVSWNARHAVVGIGLAIGAVALASLVIAPVALRYEAKSFEVLLAGAVTGVVFELALLGIAYRLTIARGVTVSQLGLTVRGWRLSAVVLGLIASYGALYVYLGLVSLFDVEALQPSKQLSPEAFDHGIVIALIGLAVVVLAPVAEEVFFRGLLFRGFAHSFGVPAGAVISGFLFSLAHLNLGAILPFTLIGVAFAVGYQRTGSLDRKSTRLNSSHRN